MNSHWIPIAHCHVSLCISVSIYLYTKYIMHIYMCLGYVVYGQMSDRISIYTVRSCSTVKKKSKSTLRNNVDFATCDGICCKMLKHKNKNIQQKLLT